MGSNKELDPQSQAVGRGARHLSRDPIPHVEPELFAFGASILQAEVVLLDDTQLLAHLEWTISRLGQLLGFDTIRPVTIKFKDISFQSEDIIRVKNR